LNQAVPFSGIAALQAGPPPITGNGVTVGVIDNLIDFYHPDFRTAAGATRLLFLWDQTLAPVAGEAGPPIAPVLPGFIPTGGVTYGVEYNQATINAELNAFNPPGTPAYQTVRHLPPVPANINGTSGHGTFVTGAAAGNGLGQGPGTFIGAAPNANLIFVRPLGTPGIQLAADNTAVLERLQLHLRAGDAGRPGVRRESQRERQPGAARRHHAWRAGARCAAARAGTRDHGFRGEFDWHERTRIRRRAEWRKRHTAAELRRRCDIQRRCRDLVRRARHHQCHGDTAGCGRHRPRHRRQHGERRGLAP